MENYGTTSTRETCISCEESPSDLDFRPSHTSETHTHTHTHTHARTHARTRNTDTHTHILSCLQPHQRPPFLSCASPSRPAEGTPGLPLEGLSQEFPLKIPLWHCGGSSELRPGPRPLSQRQPHWKERELWWGLARTADTGAVTVPATCASAVRPLCLRAVVSQVCGFLCDCLSDPSIVYVMYVCANVITCASELPPSYT